MMAGWPW
jgi:hypothetical protein